MGCFDFHGLQNDGESIPLALFLVTLLLAVFGVNLFYWVVLRVSSCILPPCLTLVRWSLQSVAMANIISACVVLPNDIFLHTREFWHLDSGLCTFVFLVDCWCRTGILCVLLLCIADRFVSYKFPLYYKRFSQHDVWMALTLLLTWLIAAVFSLPIIASASNGENEDCGVTTTTTTTFLPYRVCGVLQDSGMAAYQFMAVFLLPTALSILLILITWKGEISGETNQNKPIEIALHKSSNRFIPKTGRYRNDVSDDEFYFDEEHDVEDRPPKVPGFLENSDQLLTNLPPATTRCTTLARLDSAARLQILRMQLESRASTLGDDGERTATPVMEAWPGDDPSVVTDRELTTPITMSGCNLRLTSPAPSGVGSPPPPPRGIASPPLTIEENRPYSSQMGNVPSSRTHSPVKIATEERQRYISQQRSPSRNKDRGCDDKHSLRGKQRHARLRQKWKAKSLQQHKALPPIPGPSKQDKTSSALGLDKDVQENMQDLTVPFCAKAAFMLVAMNLVVLLAMVIPYSLGQLVLTSCTSCQVPIGIWNLLKSCFHISAVLSPILSCRQHPALKHTGLFLIQYIKLKSCTSN